VSNWASGQQLKNGKYIIDGLLGMGGFGVTYRAKEKPSGKVVAIKTLNYRVQRKANFAELQEKFLNEAMRLAMCQHYNIVKVYPQVFQHDGLWCMVMEYVEGENLASYIKYHGVLSESKALRIIKQVGEALTVVHNQGFLHRDVKPSNIILRGDNLDAVLIDFGIAREFTTGQVLTHTNDKTQHFAPIEQSERRAERGAYTDVYALAATLYVMLTDKLPVPSEWRKPNDPLVAPKEYNSQISDRVNDAIIKGMALEPSLRPQSVSSWLGLLMPSKPAATDVKLISAVGVDSTRPHSVFSWLRLLIPSKPAATDVELISAVGVDYTRLRDLLAAQKWKDADEETAKVMLKGDKREIWLKVPLDKDIIENFPCPDLRTIDQLWVKYSGGRFGFSVQKRIWIKCGGQPGKYDDYEIWWKFGSKVGWGVKEDWIDYDQTQFTLNAPPGHLPRVDCWAWDITIEMDRETIGIYEWNIERVIGFLSSLARRLVNCSI
jgi:serine/threonine protein kinase